jgi:hypothetical protein
MNSAIGLVGPGGNITPCISGAVFILKIIMLDVKMQPAGLRQRQRPVFNFSRMSA